MTVIDILTRVDSICKKYDKYDVDKQREANISGDDAFARLYGAFETQIETALEVFIYLFCLHREDFAWFDSVPMNLCVFKGVCFTMLNIEFGISAVRNLNGGICMSLIQWEILKLDRH